jgi:hypothetical protein
MKALCFMECKENNALSNAKFMCVKQHQTLIFFHFMQNDTKDDGICIKFCRYWNGMADGKCITYF